MEEKIIEFETAKLAKEKGFNEMCFKQYNKDSSLNRISREIDVVIGSYEQLLYARKGYYPASTQSLLQRWIREKHRIHIEIKPIPFGENGFKWIHELGLMEISSLDNVSSKNTYSILASKEHVYFDDYEEALDDGLFEALKLI